ncbi:phage tail tape measure protein, partial [Bacillus sp. SJS]|uniref:phage tail tape measure protein n=1 Tax=Bacillus sp. SJS TaxID=1423321 RepID=UPI0004DCE5F5
MSGQVYEIAFRMNAAVSSSMRNAFNQANQSLGELESGSNTLNKSMGVLSKGAIAAGAAFAGIATGIGIAVKATDEYNTAMKHIQASTGTAIGDMKEIKQISKNLYNANLGEDWNDLAESISLTKSVSKLSGKELEAATKNALIYRDVWGEDISQSLKATDTMMKNFGISSTQAYNLLAQGAQKGLNKSDELMDSANEYTPYFKTLGFSANQMFDVFSAGLENGAFNLDKVGDAVKEFGIRSKDGSKASMEAYKMIGLSGDKMTQTFAKGGPEAQKAFSQVVDAIKKVKDPAVQNAAAVGLFGTQAEDLEMKVITSMGNVASQFDMAKNTMKEVGNVKYDTLTQSLQGIGRQIETGILIPIGEKVLPKMQAFSDAIKTNMPAVKKVIDNSMGGLGKTMDMAGSGLQKAFIAMAPALKSAESAIRPVISQIGESVLGIWRQITSFWNKNGASITSGFVMAAKVFGAVIGGLIGIFKSLLPIVMPIVSTIATFVMDTFAKVAAYWNENGAMILQAVQNVFAGINAVIQFLAPVILFILQSVWYNVAGVIQGALNIIMGLVTFFSALFTGNFGKMWEGVKQLFFGAIQFVWNLLSLMFVGKIITSIKSLASGVTGRIGGMWTKVKEFFDGGIAGVWTSVMGLGPKIAQGFQAAKDIAVGFARGMWNSIKQFFGNIVQGARELPGKIGQGISSMAGKALEGLKSMGNLLLSGIGTMVNGVIKGLNFVMSKLGMDLTINEWVVPQYAKGTSGHPGGLAILGDGGGPELYRTPNGHVGLSPGTDTLMNLPKGTQVVPAKETQMILSSTIPAYKNGNIGDAFNTGLNWVKGAGVAAGNAVKDTAVKAAGGVKAGAMKVKDATFDVFSYV